MMADNNATALLHMKQILILVRFFELLYQVIILIIDILIYLLGYTQRTPSKSFVNPRHIAEVIDKKLLEDITVVNYFLLQVSMIV